MSMLCSLNRLTSEQAQAARADPLAVCDLLYPGDPLPPPQPGLIARLLGKRAPPPRRRTMAWIGAAQQYELDRQWQILHFLFTGSIEGGVFPACFLCMDGENVGEDGGYGPPRLFTASQVRQIADYLAGLGEEEVLRRYQPDQIAAHGVYWLIPDTAEEQRVDALGLWSTIVEMRAFIDDTARRDCALVIDLI